MALCAQRGGVRSGQGLGRGGEGGEVVAVASQPSSAKATCRRGTAGIPGATTRPAQAPEPAALIPHACSLLQPTASLHPPLPPPNPFAQHRVNPSCLPCALPIGLAPLTARPFLAPTLSLCPCPPLLFPSYLSCCLRWQQRSSVSLPHHLMRHQATSLYHAMHKVFPHPSHAPPPLSTPPAPSLCPPPPPCSGCCPVCSARACRCPRPCARSATRCPC